MYDYLVLSQYSSSLVWYLKIKYLNTLVAQNLEPHYSIIGKSSILKYSSSNLVPEKCNTLIFKYGKCGDSINSFYLKSGFPGIIPEQELRRL